MHTPSEARDVRTNAASLTETGGPSPTIQTPRLLLRALTLEDEPGFLEFFELSREHLQPFSPLIPCDVELPRFFRTSLERSHQGFADGSACRLIAIKRDTHTIAGMFSLNNIVRGVFENADAGWQVGARHIGRGFATEGVFALLTLAFSPRPHGLGLHRVQANVIPSNLASLRVCAKCGFRVEGMARRMLRINGAWQDHVVHAKIAEEHEFTSPSTPAQQG